ncbi:MAG: hypothetical protein EXQ57_09270 [Bryobacterales bacterium]|nr:hypothetical protein [Bryobacterales bacterium]
MRFSTSTLTAGAEVVPWLAAAGGLAYSPASPPERDYFFQYSWIVPGVFASGTNRRHQYWFGNPWKDSPAVRLLFGFWNRARRGDYDALYLSNGMAVPTADVTGPLAAYRHTDIHPTGSRRERLIFIQHGSYHIGDIQSQPLADRGEAVLYRGIQKAETYLLHRLTTKDIRERLTNIHARSLTDSVVSFNTVHCNLVRCETGFLNDRSFVFDGLCREAGLEPNDPPIRSALYSGYALEEWCAFRKFGPNYVKFRTPLTNIRLTTFVCNETEVKVIDTNKLEVIEAVGCKVREVCV